MIPAIPFPAVGALAGNAVDQAIFGDKPQPQAGHDIRLTGSSEGVGIPRLYGWSRVSGNIIWATNLEKLAAQSSGGKGGPETSGGCSLKLRVIWPSSQRTTRRVGS